MGLLVSLLQLAAVVVPEQPQAGEASTSDAGDAANVLAAMMQVAFPASGDPQHTRSPKWLLLPQEELQSSSSAVLSQQQQQAGQFLVFRSTQEPAVLHVLPLSLAVAVLQLLQHLVCFEHSCLSLLAAELSSGAAAAQGHSSAGKKGRAGSSSGGSNDAGARVQLEWATHSRMTDSKQQQLLQRPQQQPWRNNSMPTSTGALSGFPSPPGLSPAVFGSSTGGGSSSSTGGQHEQQQQPRGLASLLQDAAKCHGRLLQQVGALLAAAASELPLDMQPVLLSVALSEQGLLLLLLQAHASESRSSAAALLQRLLACPAVATALASALTTPPAQALLDQQQQQQQDNGDIIMIDVEQAAGNTALQPLNNTAAARKAGGSRAASKAAQQQQQGATGAAAAGNAAPTPPQQQPQQQQAVLSAQAVQEVLLQLLDCLSFGLKDAFMVLQQQQSQLPQGIPAVLHATTTTSTSSATTASSTAFSIQAPSSLPTPFSSWPAASIRCGGSSSSSIAAAQGWGVFELQRRCCAVMACLLHSRQDVLLQYTMHQQATAGEQGGFGGAVSGVVEGKCTCWLNLRGAGYILIQSLGHGALRALFCAIAFKASFCGV